MRLFTQDDFDRFAMFSEANMDDALVVEMVQKTPLGGGVDQETWIADPAYPHPLPCRVTARDLRPADFYVALQRRSLVQLIVIVARGIVIPMDRSFVLSITIGDATHTGRYRLLDATPDASQVGQRYIVEGPI